MTGQATTKYFLVTLDIYSYQTTCHLYMTELTYIMKKGNNILTLQPTYRNYFVDLISGMTNNSSQQDKFLLWNNVTCAILFDGKNENSKQLIYRYHVCLRLALLIPSVLVGYFNTAFFPFLTRQKGWNLLLGELQATQRETRETQKFQTSRNWREPRGQILVQGFGSLWGCGWCALVVVSISAQGLEEPWGALHFILGKGKRNASIPNGS